MPLRFKRLTIENWAEPDPVNAHFARLSPVVGPVPMTGDAWARAFLAVELSPGVPDEIRDLFEAARGAMLYGWFFYPLFRLAEEQVYRVLEAAARTRYREFAGAKAQPSFHEAVSWLTRRGAIAPADEVRWRAVRELRNDASHPKYQSVMPPGAVLATLQAAAHDINELFASPGD
jgi:hypothetical protein